MAFLEIESQMEVDWRNVHLEIYLDKVRLSPNLVLGFAWRPHHGHLLKMAHYVRPNILGVKYSGKRSFLGRIRAKSLVNSEWVIIYKHVSLE